MNKPIIAQPTISEPIEGEGYKPGARIAIAMQGGGSHAAFCAGVLEGLLEHPEVAHNLVGLSGTSGAAHAAAIGWAWLHKGDVDKARRMLLTFWRDMAAEISEPFDWGANQLTQTLSQSSVKMELSPYDLPASWWADYGLNKLRQALRATLPGGDLPGTPNPAAKPHLRIGAAEILTGEHRAISGVDSTIEHLLASATLPEVFPAAEISDGNRWDGTYWDGLFAMNPPIAALLDLPDDHFPEEIWVVRVNPKTRTQVPRTPREIADRRNELAGNLSLEQEIAQIRRVNKIIRDNETCTLVEKRASGQRRYKIINMREIWLEEGALRSRRMDLASKLDRTPAFIEELLRHGHAQAARFLARLPASVA